MNDIPNKYKSLIDENYHGIYGLGEILVEYDNKEKTYKVFVKYNRFDNNNEPYILLTGEEAKKAYLKYSDPEVFVDKISIDDLIKTILELFNITKDQLLGSNRKKELVLARQLVMWYAHKYFNLSLGNAGALVNRDHSTVCHTDKKIGEDKFLSNYQLEKKIQLKTEMAKKSLKNK